MERTYDGPEFARVIKRLKDKDRRPIRIASDNPILDTRMYEVEYANGYKSAMAANMTENNLLHKSIKRGNVLYCLMRLLMPG